MTLETLQQANAYHKTICEAYEEANRLKELSDMWSNHLGLYTISDMRKETVLRKQNVEEPYDFDLDLKRELLYRVNKRIKELNTLQKRTETKLKRLK